MKNKVDRCRMQEITFCGSWGLGWPLQIVVRGQSKGELLNISHFPNHYKIINIIGRLGTYKFNISFILWVLLSYSEVLKEKKIGT